MVNRTVGGTAAVSFVITDVKIKARTVVATDRTADGTTTVSSVPTMTNCWKTTMTVTRRW